MNPARTIALLLSALPLLASAQTATVAQVEAAEKSFWQGYNSCDYKALESTLAADVEFYHDMGGPTKSKAALIGLVRTNICGNAQHKVRRQAGTDAKTFLLKQGDAVYGALVTGSHFFHAKHGAAAEAPEGRALYSHLWLNNAGKWELSRVVSYEHGPFSAAPAAPVAATALTAAQIERYAGNFAGPGMPPLVFSRTGENLTVAYEGKQLVLHPLAKADTFVIKENNAEVEFAPVSGQAQSVVIRMNGKAIGEAKRQ